MGAYGGGASETEIEITKLCKVAGNFNAGRDARVQAFVNLMKWVSGGYYALPIIASTVVSVYTNDKEDDGLRSMSENMIRRLMLNKDIREIQSAMLSSLKEFREKKARENEKIAAYANILKDEKKPFLDRCDAATRLGAIENMNALKPLTETLNGSPVVVGKGMASPLNVHTVYILNDCAANSLGEQADHGVVDTGVLVSCLKALREISAYGYDTAIVHEDIWNASMKVVIALLKEIKNEIGSETRGRLVNAFADAGEYENTLLEELSERSLNGGTFENLGLGGLANELRKEIKEVKGMLADARKAFGKGPVARTNNQQKKTAKMTNGT